MGHVHFTLDGSIPQPSPHKIKHIKPMKIKPSLYRQAFTLIELLVVISIIAIIASLAMPAFSSFMQNSRMTEQMSNGLNVFKAMASYGSESGHNGLLPIYKDPDDPATKVTNSNEALQILLEGNYIDDKRVFINKASEWCKPVQKNDDTTAKQVQVRESDWVYVVGIGDTSSSRWPVLANAFAPGTTSSPSYVTDTGKKGGVWKGTKAVVIYRGGNGEVGATTKAGDSYFVKRTDQPKENAFVPKGDWLSGSDIEILYPQQ